MESGRKDTPPKKWDFHAKDDALILVILVVMIAIYMLAGLLVTPVQNNLACQDNTTIVYAATKDAIGTRNKFCVYSSVVKQTCVKVNERLTVCDNGMINSLLKGR